MKEIWKDIQGFEGYQVSNIGRVKRKFYKRWIELNKSYASFPEHFIKPYNDKDGYLKVRLHENGKSKAFFIHRLISIAFIPNPENKPQVNHKDGIKDNNIVYNLEWVTASEQRQHAYDTGLQSAQGEKNGQSKLTREQVGEIRIMYSYGYTQQNIADKYDISRAHVSGILNYNYWNTTLDSIYDIHLVFKMDKMKCLTQ